MDSAIHIVVVEDDALIAIVIEDALSEAGFTAHHVMSGDEAVAALTEHKAACLVTDIRVAGEVDGWAVGRAAREMMPHLPVVHVSGDSAHEHTARGVPGSVMLQKPFANAQLVTAISTLLNAVPPPLT